MRKTQTRRALLTSVLALVLCVAMLASSTYAWFTDSATVSVNKIQSGKLDIQLLDKDGNSIEGQALAFKNVDNSANILWEPGCTYVLEDVIIKNAGNLACKYEVVITGINGDAKLNEAIEWDIKIEIAEDDNTPEVLEPKQADVIKISGHMKEDAGDEYQDLTIDGIAITVVATQVPFEKDSVDENYDKDATAASEWDGNADAAGLAENTNETAKTVEIKTAAQFKAFADAVNAGNTYEGYTVKLMTPVDLANKAWAPIGNVNSYPSTTFEGTFDGNGLTISNLKVEVAGAYATAGLFGSACGATIKNVVIDGADIKSEHYAAGIVGYESTESSPVIVTGCTVKNATIVSSTNGTGDNGDKVGGIIGYAATSKNVISGNTVENCTIIAYRDAAGIIGFAANGLIVKENTVINTTVAQDASDDYKAPNTPKTFGAIVGSGTPALKNNTEIDCKVATKEQVVVAGDSEYAISAADEGKVIVGNGETVITNTYTTKDVTVIDCVITYAPTSAAAGSRVSGEVKYVGCTFVGGEGKASFWSDSVAENANISFIDCEFKSMVKCGGAEGATYTFANCTFSGPYTWKYMVAYSDTTLDNCTFEKGLVVRGSGTPVLTVINTDVAYENFSNVVVK